MKLKIITVIIFLLAVGVFSCQNTNSLDFHRYYSAGKRVYINHCQNCHGDNGEGLQMLIPPLTDSAFLRRNLKLLPCIVKNGLNGNIVILKKGFEWQMPPANLNYQETAQALTYITNSFGNHLGVMTYDEVIADVAKCR